MMNPRCRGDSIQRRYAMRMTKTDIFPALNMDRRKRRVFQVRIQHRQFSSIFIKFSSRAPTTTCTLLDIPMVWPLSPPYYLTHQLL